MSAADNAQLKNALSGSFVQFAVVENLGQAGETETIVGYTKGETTLSNESTDMEIEFHESKWTQTFAQHENISLEFMTHWVDDMPQLRTLGIVDANGEPVDVDEVDLRFYVYAEEPKSADAAGQVVELYRSDVRWGEATLATDNSEMPMVARVNGGYKFAKTTV